MTQETEADQNVRNAAQKLSGAVHAEQQRSLEITKSDQQYVDYARKLTEQIKDAAEILWDLLDRMQSEELWRYLGYSSWKAYVDGEMPFSERRSYQLLNHGRVMKALTDGTKVQSGDENHISEHEARGIDPEGDVMGQVRDVRERVAQGKAAKEATGQRDHEHKFVCTVCDITAAQAAKEKTLWTDDARMGKSEGGGS